MACGLANGRKFLGQLGSTALAFVFLLGHDCAGSFAAEYFAEKVAIPGNESVDFFGNPDHAG